MTGTRNRARTKARRCAVQALYQWQLSEQAPAEIVEEFRAEREIAGADQEYFERLVRDVSLAAPALVAHLGPVMDRDWQRIDPVERAILLLGAYELCHCRDIPWRVVITEAVELGKMFGAEQGHRYVNAALDRLARTVRPAEIATT
jgi:N utilization substance protein B